VEFQCPNVFNLRSDGNIGGLFFLLDAPANPAEIPRKQPADEVVRQSLRNRLREICSIFACPVCKSISFYLIKYGLDICQSKIKNMEVDIRNENTPIEQRELTVFPILMPNPVFYTVFNFICTFSNHWEDGGRLFKTKMDHL
jgi:hypothetical protein